ncbi:hypothetical protein ACS126_18010 [Sphingobacterium lactis]|uniref:hypothetical protein n=1 Tax=Sphingobacterium TaxID=28453 RepID=UPI000B942CEC|nr:hypothetical protein CHT99_10300 [Sphingobacterium cellulitidis]
MARGGVVINTLGKDLERYRKDIVKQVKTAISDIATDLEISSKRDLKAASSRPDLIEEFEAQGLNFILVNKKFSKGGLKAEVGVWGDNNMAAYIEFGTGLSAREILAPYPQWVKDIAWTFKGDFDGSLKGSPYLYSNYFRLMPEYQIKLKAILDKKYKV